ncbi:MAG: hypothetical protein LBK12_05005 [Odoribacteraceae bacterium]|jgi:hypothetical protein|nr:hypothetical protein [Odoribacteraceae bacterium]
MDKQKINLRFGVITGIILLAAMTRLIPRPANFAPIGGMALFGAAYYSRRYWAFIIPIASMWISDVILNNTVYARYFDHFVWFYGGSLFTFAAFALIALFGMYALKRVRVYNLIAAALGASAIFFLVSNFGAWITMDAYPKTPGGLMACYAAGLPFLKGTVLGDLVYTGLLCGAFEYGMKRFPRLRLPEVSMNK